MPGATVSCRSVLVGACALAIGAAFAKPVMAAMPKQVAIAPGRHLDRSGDARGDASHDQDVVDQPRFVPRLQSPIMPPGCGHWIEQERATEVSATLIDLLRHI